MNGRFMAPTLKSKLYYTNVQSNYYSRALHNWLQDKRSKSISKLNYMTHLHAALLLLEIGLGSKD